MTTIAFLGLGHMGGPMSANLVAAGHTVRGYDPAPAAAKAAADKGVEIFDSAPQAVSDADVVITMLTSGDIVKRCYEEVLPAAAEGALFIDSSTISVDDARRANEMASNHGFAQLDAPVSGGVKGAVQQIVVGEAFVLAEKLGLSAQSLFEVITGATGNCWAVHTNCPVPGPVPTSPANNAFRPGFATALMNKDLGLAMDAVKSTGSFAPLGSHAAEIYAKFATHHADKDFSAVIEMIRDA